MAGLLELLGAQEEPQYAQAPKGLLSLNQEIEIGGHKYEMIPPEQFNHDNYDVMERYYGKFARPNPPAYLLGNHPDDPDRSPKTIRYWRRVMPFAGS